MLGLILLVSGCSSSETPSGQAAPPADSRSDSADSAASPTDAGHVDGTITAQNGATWILTTDNNKTYTVTVTDATKFGDSDSPQTKDQIKVGTKVDVTGEEKGTSITATSIEAF